MKVREKAKGFFGGFLDTVIEGALDPSVQTPWSDQKRAEAASYASMMKAALESPSQTARGGGANDTALE